MANLIDINQSYFSDIAEYSLLTVEEEKAIADKARAGEQEAIDKLVLSNLRLVVKIANEYSVPEGSKMDLISEGNIGLMRAATKFNPDRGNRFISYAVWWIRQGMNKFIYNKGFTIRMPIHQRTRLAKINKSIEKLTTANGEAPSTQELSKETGIPEAKLREYNLQQIKVVSMDGGDSEWKSDDTYSYSDHIADHGAPDPSSNSEVTELYSVLVNSLDILTAHERDIITSRFGLDGKRARTLDQIGKRVGVTRERIRQIQNSILDKLQKQLKRKADISQCILNEEYLGKL